MNKRFITLTIIVFLAVIVVTAISFFIKPYMQTIAQNMKLTSHEFEDNGFIPARFSCHYENINPELDIENTPSNVQSLVLIMDDPDAPSGDWVHWILFNISPTTLKILENETPSNAIVGKNSWGKSEYGGPCPPLGTHRYVFKLYALNKKLELQTGSTKQQVEAAMQNHLLAEAKLTGLFSK